MDIVVKVHVSNLQLTICRRDVKDKDGVLAYPYSQVFPYRQRKNPSLTQHYEVLSMRSCSHFFESFLYAIISE